MNTFEEGKSEPPLIEYILDEDISSSLVPPSPRFFFALR